MAAIGINASDRDLTYTWGGVKPEPVSRLQSRYYQAKDRADTAWKWYYEAVDQLEYVQTKFSDDHRVIEDYRRLMNEALVNAENADRERHTAYLQMNCSHNNVETYGDPESWVSVCEDCGAEF